MYVSKEITEVDLIFLNITQFIYYRGIASSVTFGAPKRLGSGARLLNSNVVSQLRGFFVPDFLNPRYLLPRVHCTIVKTPSITKKNMLLTQSTRYL